MPARPDRSATFEPLDTRRLLGARLGSFCFLFFAGFGVLLPYWPLYPSELGLRPRQIGHVVALQLVHRWLAGPVQARGQALSASVSAGIGGAGGALLAGLGWQSPGPTGRFISAAVCYCMGFTVAAIGLSSRDG